MEDGRIEDYFEETTTDDDSSSDSKDAVFDSSPYILNVHEISKDENTVQSPANPSDTQTATGQATGQAGKQKVKKIKKKKKKTPSQATVSSESASEISVPTVAAVVEEPGKEEFYDARENALVIPGVPTDLVAPAPLPAAVQGAVVAAGLVQARSEHAPEPKQGTGPTPARAGQRSSKTPSAVTKPIDPPE